MPVWINKNMDGHTHFEMLTEKVVPAILAKWPRHQGERFFIVIQQDVGPGHMKNDFQERWTLWLVEQVLLNVFEEGQIEFYTQPVNSPDSNILDLGFFCALQSLYYQEVPRDAGEMITMVVHVHQLYPSTKFNRVWLTLMDCMNEILGCRGGNEYKIPHRGTAKLETEGSLPAILDLHLWVAEVIDKLDCPDATYEDEPDVQLIGTVSEQELLDLQADAAADDLSDGSLESWESEDEQE
jgi:hypothetical protein